MLEDFGFGDVNHQDGEDEEGLGASQYANSLDHSDVRQNIKEAMRAHDEVALGTAIDVARELGQEYPFKYELDQAEGALYEMMNIPDFPVPETS